MSYLVKDGAGTLRTVFAFLFGGTQILPVAVAVDDAGDPTGTAENPTHVVAAPSVQLGYEQVSGLDTATGLTAPVDATYALIVVEGANVRWRDDGVDPTAEVGMPLMAGQTFQGSAPFRYDGDLSEILFIEQTPSAILNVSYYK